MALELGCYICTLGTKVKLVPEAVFDDGRKDLCLGFCLYCSGSVCTGHGAWVENPKPEYICSVCLGDWIGRGGNGGPLHRREPTPDPSGGGGALRSTDEVLANLSAAGLKEAVLVKVKEAFEFWAYRLYETRDLTRINIVEPVALRSVYSAYMDASGMAVLLKAAKRATVGA